MSVFSGFWNSNNTWRRRHGAPRNRRELFFCVLSDQFFSLIFLNFFYGIFFLPAVLWSAVMLVQTASLFQNGDTVDSIRSMTTLFFGLIPLLTLTGPARVGMARLMRDWAREEYLPPLRTFWPAVKSNWKQALVPAFITALFPLILWNSFQFVSGHPAQALFPYLLVLAGILFLFWLLMQQIIYSLIVTYDLPLKGHFRNAILLTIMNFPRSLLILVGSLFPIGLYVLFIVIRPDMYLSLLIIPILYYFFIGWCLADLIFGSYANYLIRKHFPAPQ